MRTSILTTLFAIICGTVSETKNCNLEKSVALVGDTYQGLTFGRNETIVHPQTGEVRGCVCLKGLCARKCCPSGQAYLFVNRTCVPTNKTFDPPVVENKGGVFKLIEGFNVSEKFTFIYGKMLCAWRKNEKRLPVLPNFPDFKFTTNGKLYVQDSPFVPDVYKFYEPDQYCIDMFVSDPHNHHYNALICYQLGTTKSSQPYNYALSSGIKVVSCFFLLLTAVVYLWVPELRSLHAMVLIPYLFCFFMDFLILSTRQFLILGRHHTPDLCTVLIFSTYFFVEAVQFWQNIMCYDVWSTFRGIRAHGRSGSPHERFIYYANYAFGVPIALTSLLAACEFTGILSDSLRSKGCFVNSYKPNQLVFVYLPILMLSVASMTFLGRTVSEIWTIKKEAHVLQVRDGSTSDQVKKETDRFILYVKMYIVTAVNWVLDVVVYFYPDADFFFYFVETYHVVLGFLIFVIFVCNKDTWNLIKKRYRQLKSDPLSRTQTTTSSTTRIHSTSCDDMRMNSIKN